MDLGSGTVDLGLDLGGALDLDLGLDVDLGAGTIDLGLGGAQLLALRRRRRRPPRCVLGGLLGSLL